MERFEYCNPNPKRKSVGDCVIRALSIALDKPWEETYMEICAQGFKMADMSGMPSTRTFKIEEIGDMPVGAASKSEVPPNISREEIEGFENRISALEKQIQGMTAKPKGKTKEAAENESTV